MFESILMKNIQVETELLFSTEI